MATGEIHAGDIGTAFRATIRDESGNIKDLSSASLLQLIFRKPDSTLLTKTATLYTNGVDGIIQWSTTSASDLDLVGPWKIQGKVVISGATHRSDVQSFDVFPNLD